MGSGEISREDLRELLHDVHGEIFLLRGFLDLQTRSFVPNQEQSRLISRMEERLDALQRLVNDYHKKVLDNPAVKLPSDAEL